MRNVLMLVVLCYCTLYGNANRCDSGWFGARCQYKCHCMNGQQCDQYGTCPDFKCASGWFGPACQYADLAATNSSKYSDKYQGILTDNNDTSCYNSTSPGEITVTLDKAYPFTWLRIHVNDPYLIYNFTVKFSDGGTTSLECENERRAVVSDKTLDIHCDLNVTVTQVILEGEGVKALCSLHISGGRNIALKENASQSSNHKNLTAAYAVDGDTVIEWRPGACAHTESRDLSPHWNLFFKQPSLVTRYVLYNKNNELSYRLQGFTLQSFGKDGSVVFNYTDQDQEKKVLSIYTVIQIPWQKPVSSITIYPKRQKKELWFPLCEVEVYGDVVCETGKYGRECGHKCNCANNESCFVSTGGCPSGCAPGFKGENCYAGCRQGTFGESCKFNCSQHCSKDGGDDWCDAVNGQCLNGCQNGYEGFFCNACCRQGTFGESCKFNCSQHCSKDGGDDWCDTMNGQCLNGCQAGYEGLLCNTYCQEGTYGQDCEQHCSTHCKSGCGRCCDPVNGTCLYGCQAGYSGSHCNTSCGQGTFGEACKFKCSQHCSKDGGDDWCDTVSGQCLKDCQTGYEGLLCNTMKSDDSELTGRLLIYVGAAANFVVIIVVVVAIICYKVKLQPRREQVPVIYDHTETRFDNKLFALMSTSEGLYSEAGTDI